MPSPRSVDRGTCSNSGPCHGLCLKVRKSTADQFYLCLMTFDDLVEEETVEEVTAILSETAWLEDWYDLLQVLMCVCVCVCLHM